MQRVDQRHQRGAFGLDVEHVEQPPVGAGVALAGPGRQRVHQPLQFEVGAAELIGVDEVLGQLVGCSRSTIAVTAAGVLPIGSGPGMAADHLIGQLPALGFAEQPGVGFDRQQQAELAQQRPAKAW